MMTSIRQSRHSLVSTMRTDYWQQCSRHTFYKMHSCQAVAPCGYVQFF